MVCKLCGKRATKYIKVKNGIICPNCYDNLPTMVADNVRDLTPQNIKSTNKIMGKVSSVDNYWGYIDEDYTFMFSDDRLCVDETEILYKNIKDIYLNFHPTDKVNSSNTFTGLVKGYTTLVVITKKPEIRIEKRLAKKDNIRYSIHGNDITYIYETLDLLLVSNIKKVILKEERNLGFFKEEFIYKVNETELERIIREVREREKENEENEKLKQKYEDAKRKIEEEEKRKREEKFNRRNKKNEGKRKDANKEKELSNFEKAQKLFGVEIPYTEDEIKKAYYKLIKSNHPDEGGTAEDASKINSYYDLLKKFAVNK